MVYILGATRTKQLSDVSGGTKVLMAFETFIVERDGCSVEIGNRWFSKSIAQLICKTFVLFIVFPH